MPILAGAGDIRGLRPLIAAAEQEYDCPTGHGEVHAVSGPDVYPQLPYPIATGCMIAEVAQGHAIHAAVNCQLSDGIPNCLLPVVEDISTTVGDVMPNLEVHHRGSPGMSFINDEQSSGSLNRTVRTMGCYGQSQATLRVHCHRNDAPRIQIPTAVR